MKCKSYIFELIWIKCMKCIKVCGFMYGINERVFICVCFILYMYIDFNNIKIFMCMIFFLRLWFIDLYFEIYVMRVLVLVKRLNI